MEKKAGEEKENKEKVTLIDVGAGSATNFALEGSPDTEEFLQEKEEMRGQKAHPVPRNASRI